MNFSITIESDLSAEKKTILIINLSNELKEYFKVKTYGNDIETYLIGCICVKTKIGYEEWYKKRKPKFIDLKVTKSKVTGESFQIKNTYSYDIKIDNEEYDKFITSTDQESQKILATEILNSLFNLDALPIKVRDFDKEKFKSDMKAFFKEKKLL